MCKKLPNFDNQEFHEIYFASKAAKLNIWTFPPLTVRLVLSNCLVHVR